MKRYCICGRYIYDEAIGDPERGIEPGTKYKSLPDHICCPYCKHPIKKWTTSELERFWDRIENLAKIFILILILVGMEVFVVFHFLGGFYNESATECQAQIICSVCNNEVDDNYCTNCGSKAEPSTYEVVEENVKDDLWSRITNGPWLYIGIAILLIGCVITICVFTCKKKRK